MSPGWGQAARAGGSAGSPSDCLPPPVLWSHLLQRVWPQGAPRRLQQGQCPDPRLSGQRLPGFQDAGAPRSHPASVTSPASRGSSPAWAQAGLLPWARVRGSPQRAATLARGACPCCRLSPAPHVGVGRLSCRGTTWWGSTAACCVPRSSAPRAGSSTTSSRPTRRWVGSGATSPQRSRPGGRPPVEGWGRTRRAHRTGSRRDRVVA